MIKTILRAIAARKKRRKERKLIGRLLEVYSNAVRLGERDPTYNRSFPPENDRNFKSYLADNFLDFGVCFYAKCQWDLSIFKEEWVRSNMAFGNIFWCRAPNDCETK